MSIKDIISRTGYRDFIKGSRYIPTIALTLALAACGDTGSAVLQKAGVAPGAATTIVADAAAAGQLFCQSGTTWLMVVGVNVKGATADTVAKACAVATAVGAFTPPTTPVPGAPPPGTLALIATAATDVAAAVKASQGAS